MPTGPRLQIRVTTLPAALADGDPFGVCLCCRDAEKKGAYDMDIVEGSWIPDGKVYPRAWPLSALNAQALIDDLWKCGVRPSAKAQAAAGPAEQSGG